MSGRVSKTTRRRHVAGHADRPAARRSPSRRRRMVSPKQRRAGLRWALLAVLAAATVGVPSWWWWSGGLERSWTQARLAGARIVAEMSTRAGLVVATVRITGRKRTSARMLARALDANRGQSILSVDLDAAKRRIEGLPWVRTAEVERRLPDAIRVRIVERAPFALWQRKRRLALIDGDGVMIQRTASPAFAALPIVVGPRANRRAAALLRMLDTEPALRRLVVAAVWIGGRRWDVRLAGGIVVRLPDKDAAAAWRRLAAATRRHALLTRDVVVIDLRFADRVVIRTGRRPGPRRKPAPPIAAGKNT